MKTILTLRHSAHWACALVLAAGLAHAEASTPATPEQPTAVPAPFDTYQRWRDVPVADWRERNERVLAVGGWRTYLREAQGEGANGDAHAPHQHEHHHHQHKH